MSGHTLRLEADILVIGGGLAGTWAALTAAEAGARVIIAEKGYCGTSGVAASAGPGHWFIPPDQREAVIAQRLQSTQGLGNPDWMARILDRTWRELPRIGTHYRHTPDDEGRIRHHALRGPEYLRALREKAKDAGAIILDHSPAQNLLAHPDGSIAGACGICRQGDHAEWHIEARATILATGGCAFRSRLLGAATNTGDGLLMAVEAGARLSGMEFSAYFTVAPAGTTMTRTMIFAFARYYDTHGQEITGLAPHDNRALAAALANGPVWCDLSRVPHDVRAQLPQVSPNVVVTFQRLGIDPFTQRFPITLIGEGTIRGTGGVQVTDTRAGCGVPGLFVAGDVASREPVTGPISGGGAVNAAWALASGCIAADSALLYARKHASTRAAPGLLGTRTTSSEDALLHAEASVQREMLTPDLQYNRNAPALLRSRDKLDGAWQTLHSQKTIRPDTRLRQKSRETRALTAVARWCTASALARTASLGLHHRRDTTPSTPPAHIISAGFEAPWTRIEPR